MTGKVNIGFDVFALSKLHVKSYELSWFWSPVRKLTEEYVRGGSVEKRSKEKLAKK